MPYTPYLRYFSLLCLAISPFSYRPNKYPIYFLRRVGVYPLFPTLSDCETDTADVPKRSGRRNLRRIQEPITNMRIAGITPNGVPNQTELYPPTLCAYQPFPTILVVYIPYYRFTIRLLPHSFAIYYRRTTLSAKSYTDIYPISLSYFLSAYPPMLRLSTCCIPM